MIAVEQLENARLALQSRLDAAKTQMERNKNGQFATPTVLAKEILEQAKSLITPGIHLRFLDPAFGTGSFYSALLDLVDRSSLTWAQGYEIDPHYGCDTAHLWGETPLQLHIADFTQAIPPTTDSDRANLVICNPPYVRHHHMSRTEKARLNQLVRHRTGIHLNGLAGLYCYFLCLAHEWMAQDALAGWLIPSEFMDVNYGVQLKEYLLRKVTLLQVHRFDSHDVQFDDALVSSSIVWFRKSPCPPKHPILFTYGPHLAAPEITRTLFVEDVSVHSKWTRIAREPDISPSHHSSNTNQIRLGDLFTVRRGLATGANEFFILTEQQVHEYNLPPRFLQPILPSPRYLPLDEVAGDDLGVPLIQRRLFLLRCNAPEEMVHSEYPDLWAYLQRGRKQGIHNRYLCAHRSPWYLQEDRPPTPFLCTYMGRADTSKGTPFRFILNHSQATAPNVYLLLYPRPSLQKVLVQQPRLLIEVWEALNKLPLCSLTSEGRVYGGGLYKMEPRELSNVPADDVMQIIRQNDEFIHFRQQRLFEKRLGDQYILRE